MSGCRELGWVVPYLVVIFIARCAIVSLAGDVALGLSSKRGAWNRGSASVELS